MSGREVVSEDAEVRAFLVADVASQARQMAAWGVAPAVLLILTNACENRCFFCANAGTTAVPPERFTPWADIDARLRARPEGVTRLLIGGNEPMLHPRFRDALALAKAVGFTSIELMTSGMQLADPTARAAVLEAGLADVAVPIYAAEPALHDAICQTTCWDRLTEGLDAVHAAGVRVWVHTLALRRNGSALDGLATMVRQRWGTALAVAPVREKLGLFPWMQEALSLEEMGALCRSLPPDVTLVGWPACLDRGRPRGSASVMELYFRTQLRTFADACAGCADRAGCPGVVDAQLRKFGASGLVPRAQ